MSGPPPGVRTTPPPDTEATRVVLIRHGESACNVAGVVGGHTGCTGLSPRGRLEASALCTRLLETSELAGTDGLYASVLARARETASIIAPGVGGQLAATDCDLCELHPGDADGLSWDEFRTTYGEPDWDEDPDALVAPGGESWTGFVTRASAAVERLAHAHQGGLVVVVCHGGVIEATMLRFLPVAAHRGRLRLPTDYTSLTEWELGPFGWRLVRYNDAAHLRVLDRESRGRQQAQAPQPVQAPQQA